MALRFTVESASKESQPWKWENKLLHIPQIPQLFPLGLNVPYRCIKKNENLTSEALKKKIQVIIDSFCLD